MLKFTGLDSAVASSTNYTIFAPVNSAWKNEKYKSLLAKKTDRNRDILYGILSRHVIVGKHVSENCVPYEKLRTIIDAPIYLERDGNLKTISSIEISETDNEGFNGLINTISKVTLDQMELPEGDISWSMQSNLFKKHLITRPNLCKWRFFKVLEVLRKARL